jgi:hypothetical protein
MLKRRVITSLEKLSPETLQRLFQQYPDGWSQHVKRITKPSGDFFHAVALETDEIAYLVKVPVKVDSRSELEKEEEKLEHAGDFSDNEDSGKGDPDGSSYNEPSENPYDD